MTFNENADQPRESDGKFGEKIGSAPGITLDRPLEMLEPAHRLFTERRENGLTVVRPIRGISDDWEYVDSRVEHLATLDGFSGAAHLITESGRERVYDVTLNRTTEGGEIKSFETRYLHDNDRPIQLASVAAYAAAESRTAEEYDLNDVGVKNFSQEFNYPPDFENTEDPWAVARQRLSEMHTTRTNFEAFIDDRDRYADYVYGSEREAEGFGPSKYTQE